jgi:phosphocarrier protein
VKDAGVPVKIAKDGKPPVNAASLLSLLTLGAEFGDEVTLSAEGEGAETALDGLAEMLGRDLDAE